MMSKLFKSMQAWWPANEGEKETSKSLQLTEARVEDDTYSQEYLKALMNEQIPASLLDKMSELIKVKESSKEYRVLSIELKRVSNI